MYVESLTGGSSGRAASGASREADARDAGLPAGDRRHPGPPSAEGRDRGGWSGGRTFLGLHGWSGDHTTFAPLAPLAPAGTRLFAADLPGYGASPPPAQWSLDAVGDEIAATIEELASPALTLVGNCSGAILGLHAALQVPSRVERVVLIDPFAYMPWYFRIFLAGEFGRRAYRTTFASRIGRRVTNSALRGHRTGRTDLTASFGRTNHEVTQQHLRLLGGILDVSFLGDLRLPTDILYGERTFGAVRKSVAIWKRLWPHARTFELAGAGHLPLEEATTQVAEILFRP
jgi:pimeloyl-ACP methyl ester carboxylesterase